MDKAKAAVSEIMHRAGHKDTTVVEKVAPAVVNETIQRERREEIQTAIDKEVHVDHYHTSVQPVLDRQILPEQHQYNVAAPQERVISHGDDAAARARLEQERAHFRSTRTEAPVVESKTVAPTIAGEHVHHHVHETIQPIVQREVIQPSVVHTTIPIHEVHHEAPKVHATTALPAVSMSEFQRNGGTLAGREERVDAFEGEPKPISTALGGSPAIGTNTMGSQGMTGSTSMGTHSHHIGTDGPIDRHTNTTGSGGAARGPHNSSLLNKLDPRVDSTGDGKPGLMK